MKFKDGSTKQISGKWSFEGTSRNALGNHITLYPYLNCDHYGSGTYSPYGSFSITSAGLFGMQIDIDPDWGSAFRKK